MNDIITSSLHSDTLIGGGLASDSSSIKLADEEIIDGFSFLTFEFESDLKKEYERKRHDQIKPDTCYKSSASSNGSAKSFKRSKANKPRVKETLATSSTASNSSFNQDDDQASTVPSEDARAKTPTPPRPLSHHPDEQPSKKPKLDDSKSSYDMNTLLAAAASAAATAAVVAATSSPQQQQQPHQPSNSQTAPGTQFDPSSNTDPALFINKIMQMCKQQIPSLNIPGILKAEPSNIPCGVKAEANTSTGVKDKSNISSGVKVEPQVPSGVKVESKAALGVKASVAKAELVKTVSPSTSKQMPSQAYHNHHQSSKPVHTNFNASSYYMAAQHPAVEAASTTDFLRRDLDAKLLRSPHMMPASSSSNMYSHVTKHHGAHTPVKPALATGLVQYYPRTSGKWCAAHAKLANMIQEHKAKSKQQRVCGQPPPPPQFSSVPNQAMFDAYHSKKLHTPTFFPPVQHNLKPSQGGARTQNYLATEAAVTAAANHQLMMDKYRQDMMRLGPPQSMPSMMPPPPPPGIPMMPPPGIHMAPFVNKSNNKPMHPPPQPLPPPPQPPHMFPFNPNPLLQHSFLQQFFMDKNFDPTRFPFPTLPHHHQQHQQPPPPPGCLMPNMLKPDDKPIT